MINSVLLAILSMAATGFSDFFYKRARIGGAAPEFFLAFQSIFFNATSLTFAASVGHLEISPQTVFFGAACASLVYISVYLFFRGLSAGQATVNVPIFRLSFVVTAVMAFLLLNEAATFGKLLAVSLAVLSILALSKSLRAGSASLSAMLQLVFATIIYGIFGLLYKIAIALGSAPTGILIVQGSFFIVYAFVIAYQRHLIKTSRTITLHAPVCGILLSSAYLLLLESLKYGDVSVSFSIVQLSFMITSILAMLVWHEKITPMNVLGIILAILAIASFAYL
jgi:uncharacterized membrane protein